MNTRPNALLVLGTRGSGASALTRVISFGGYALPTHLTDPIQDGRVASGESSAITEFNSGILLETGCRWDEPFAFSGSGLPSVSTAYRSRAVELIRSEFPLDQPIVLTDPRIAFLYDLWSEALASCGYEPACLITVRDPADITAVRVSSSGLPLSRSILAWVSYYLAAEYATRASRRMFVSFDDFVSDWRRGINGISESLGVPIGGLERNCEQLIERFLNGDLADLPPADIPVDGLVGDASWIVDACNWLQGRGAGARTDRTALAPVLTEYQRQRARFYSSVPNVDRGVAEDASKIIAVLRSELQRQRTAAESLEREVRLREAQAFAAEEELRTILTSTTWRIAAPLRKTFQLIRRSQRLLRRQIARIPGGTRLLAAIAPPPKVRDAEPALAEAKEAFRDSMHVQFESFMASGASLRIPSVQRPVVSVVLVLWNQAPLTLACLRGLAQMADTPYEVIVIDNASTDRTTDLLDRLDGVRVIRNDHNEGFLKAVNQGVAAAYGELVLLLNNDAVLRAGSLAAACETLTADASVGAVGGRIVLLNGRLQEAGSIVWQDGSCLGYARNQPADCGESMFVRDVDYCSGAFLLFRRATFDALGGFDDAFAPAYYEEVDFCLRLWQNGLRVVYEPRAVIDHFEFASSTTTERALALQIRNRATLVAKHQAALQHQLPAAPEAILSARMRVRHRGRALFIDDRVPLQHLGSGYPRARQLLREIVDAGYFVTLYPLRFPNERWETTYASIPRTVEVAMGRGLEGLSEFIEERRGYYDAIIVSRPHNMQPLVDLHEKRPELFENVAIIYDAEAVFGMREAQKARLFNDPSALARAEAAIGDELALTEIADAIIAVSPAEADCFRKVSSAAVHVISNTLTPNPTSRPFEARRDLLFVGPLDHEGSPNVDSIAWFVTEVMPSLQQQLDPALTLQAVGGNRAPSIRALQSRHIRLIGHVESLDVHYDQSRIFIAPTRFAGGIPLKIHEAAARGLPVVATRVLADQLGWCHEVELMVADDAASFAQQVVRLYQDRALWETVRAGALKRLAQDCDPAVFRARVREVLAAAPRRAPSRLVNTK